MPISPQEKTVLKNHIFTKSYIFVKNPSKQHFSPIMPEVQGKSSEKAQIFCTRISLSFECDEFYRALMAR
jgi:hypothetical protein